MRGSVKQRSEGSKWTAYWWAKDAGSGEWAQHTKGGFATERGLMTISSYLEDVLELVAEDAVALDCRADVEDCRRIVARGSSADRQIVS